MFARFPQKVFSISAGSLGFRFVTWAGPLRQPPSGGLCTNELISSIYSWCYIK